MNFREVSSAIQAFAGYLHTPAEVIGACFFERSSARFFCKSHLTHKELPRL
jgi:hypothetical protein